MKITEQQFEAEVQKIVNKTLTFAGRKIGGHNYLATADGFVKSKTDDSYLLSKLRFALITEAKKRIEQHPRVLKAREKHFAKGGKLPRKF